MFQPLFGKMGTMEIGASEKRIDLKSIVSARIALENVQNSVPSLGMKRLGRRDARKNRGTYQELRRKVNMMLNYRKITIQERYLSSKLVLQLLRIF